MSGTRGVFGIWTWLALIGLGAAGVAIIWWFPLDWVAVVAAIAQLPLLAGLWIFMYRRSSAYRQASDARRSELRKLAAARLREELLELGEKQGVEQLSMLTEKRDDLLRVLRGRFKVDELTYSRYARSAELVFEAATSNLNQVALALNSVKSIDIDRLDVQLEELSRKSGPQVDADIESVQHRRELYAEQVSKARNLISENESALTALSKTAAALANTETSRDGESLSVEAVIAELERLAERVHRYAGR